jgi:predicted O-methyltransferase YrrM
MKQLLKTVSPVPLLNVLREIRDRSRVFVTPKQTFLASCLRSASNIKLDAAFAATAGAAWHDDHVAIRARFGDIGLRGGVNPGDRRALYHLVSVLKPKRVLEVGTHIGASTLYIACALKRIGAVGKVTTVDVLDVNAVTGPWKHIGLSNPPRELADNIGCADAIEFVTAPSLEFMSRTDTRFDFIFLDGDHAAHTVYREVAGALKILHEDGVILLHDYYPNAKPLFPDGVVIGGPFRALARITRENSSIGALPLGNLPWPTKQGTHATSLALVVRAS